MPIVNDIGELKWRSTILLRQEVKDNMGGRSGNKSKYVIWRHLYGKLMAITDRDLAVAGQTINDVSCKFIIRYNKDLYKLWQLQQASNTPGGASDVPADRSRADLRIIVDHQTYDVVGIIDPDAQKHWLQLSLREVWSNPAEHY